MSEKLQKLIDFWNNASKGKLFASYTALVAFGASAESLFNPEVEYGATIFYLLTCSFVTWYMADINYDINSIKKEVED